jgi:hypothetical protein
MVSRAARQMKKAAGNSSLRFDDDLALHSAVADSELATASACIREPIKSQLRLHNPSVELAPSDAIG